MAWNRASAGSRRERISFEQKVRIDDPYGGQTTNWASPAPPNDKRWAQVTTRKTNSPEQLIAGANSPVHSLRFTIPYDVGFWNMIKDGTWRILYRGMIFDIDGALPSNDNKSIEIHGRLHVNQG